MPRELPPGIRRTKYGFEVRARVGASKSGRSLARSKHYTKEASIRDMKAWRDATIVALRAELAVVVGPVARRGTLADDIERYLKLVAAMPSFESRARDLKLWRDRFGDLSRHAVTTQMVREQLQEWRVKGPRYRWRGRKDGKLEIVPGPASASTCNHRRTALMHFYRVLDGRNGFNPVRDVPPFKEPPPEPRGKDLAVLQLVIARVESEQNRRRLEVLLWTGMRVSELQAMKPDHVDLTNQVCYVRSAKGGAGYRPVPLNAEGVRAWRDFMALNLWGKFDKQLIRNSLKRAFKSEQRDRGLKTFESIRVHDLRHSLAQAYLAAGADLADVQELLGHTTPRMTRRYAPFRLAKLARVTQLLSCGGGVRAENDGEEIVTRAH